MMPLSGDNAAETTERHNTNNTLNNISESWTDSVGLHASMDNGSPIPPHPLGIKPLGNQYLATVRSARDALGTVSNLPDEVLMIFLEYLDIGSLQALGSTCRFLFAFCSAEELWKPLLLETQNGNSKPFTWQGLWRSTVLERRRSAQAEIVCDNVFSDVLHRPFACSHISLEQFATGIPRSNEIQRLENLSYDEFSRTWSNSPFILTQCIQSWPVLAHWSLDKFSEMYADIEFRAEAVDWPFSTYHSYMVDNQDESPLYLFDKKFAEKMGVNVGREDGAAYWKPDCFGPDLFDVLGPERPAHRWLIIGPERSGSTFHKDPNGTSAWNAVVQGAKYWIIFPPSVAVPGVYVSKDNSEVTSPLSIAEWLLEFHEEARQLPDCVEGICRAGEILHVPSGWWHLVVNLERGIALTQNFVSKAHLTEVLGFLRDKPEQVTGFKQDIADPYALFVERLQQECPGVLREALDEMQRKSDRSKKRTWDVAVGRGDEGQDASRDGGFTFGFGFGDDDADEIP